MADSWISNLADTFKNTSTSALGAGFRALRDPSGFLKDELPPEADDLTKWIQDRNRRACRLHARNEAAGLYSDLGALRRPRYGHCTPYLDSINEGPTSSGSYEPPFSGGQCEGTIYQVIVTLTLGTDVPGGCDPPFDISVNGAFGVPGPIRGLSLGSVVIPGANLPGKSAALNYGQNQQISLGQTFGGCNTPFAVIKSVTRLSGNPDTCGDPPPEYRPPSYPPNLPPLPPTTVAPPGGDGGDDIQVDPDGNWRICEDGECTPWFPPGGGSGPDSGGGPGEEDGPPQENDPNDPNDPNEITGCVEAGNILTGLRIELTDIPSGSKVTDGNYYGVAWVYMGPDSDKLDLISDGRWVYSGQFFLPDSDSCTCYKVKVRYPWGIRVQPFSRPKEE